MRTICYVLFVSSLFFAMTVTGTAIAQKRVLPDEDVTSHEADHEEMARYGSLWLGGYVGPAVGFNGPRGGYTAGLKFTYKTPHYFNYSLGLAFLHLLPTSVNVSTTTDENYGDEIRVVQAHEVNITGLYGVPLTFDVSLQLPLEKVALRAGVGIGSMVAVQTLDASVADSEQEWIVSFCFNPTIGADITTGERGILRLDLAYLWQDARFEISGGGSDSHSLMLTIGYAWLLIP